MQLHQLQRTTPNKKKKRVGRGGRRGKTSGKGHKGQKARAGGRPRPELRDIIKRLPKQRGYKFSAEPKPAIVNTGVLESVTTAGDTVTPSYLLEKGLIERVQGRMPRVKVLAKGPLTKAITLNGCLVSDEARKKIERVGGAVAA